jgi:hypothetical protein
MGAWRRFVRERAGIDTTHLLAAMPPIGSSMKASTKVGPIRLTLILFPVGSDEYSAVAVESDRRSNVWKNKWRSRDELVDSFDELGVLTYDELMALQDGSRLRSGDPFSHIAVEPHRMERAGFERVMAAKPN